MKKQINIGNGNTQVSDDDTTTQVQVGWKEMYILTFLLANVIFWSIMGISLYFLYN